MKKIYQEVAAESQHSVLKKNGFLSQPNAAKHHFSSIILADK